MNVEFDCSACGQKLRAQRASLGKLCKCTKCGGLVRIVEPPLDRLLVEPIKLGPKRNPLVEELNEIASRPHRPPPSEALEKLPASATYGPLGSYQTRARQPKTSRGWSASSVITTLLSVVGILGVLCCGGLGVAFVALGQQSTVIKAAGYEATAGGRSTRQEANGQGTMHPLTGSEFWIGQATLPLGSAAGIEDMQTYCNTISQRTEVVQRGDLRGVRCYGVDTRKLGIPAGIDAEFEIFLVGNRLLFTAYIPGTSKSEARGRIISPAAEARSRSMDKVDSFFASLKRSGT